MFTIALRGDAQKLLGGLTSLQLSDYDTLIHILTQRFNPQEREIAFRYEFKNRRRLKGEHFADFGYSLRRLGQRAYPRILYSQLEGHIIDQFILNFELQRHVQLNHPMSLDHAISLTVEYCTLQESLDR